jgi:hypothetical protein
MQDALTDPSIWVYMSVCSMQLHRHHQLTYVSMWMFQPHSAIACYTWWSVYTHFLYSNTKLHWGLY